MFKKSTISYFANPNIIVMLEDITDKVASHVMYSNFQFLNLPKIYEFS